MPIRDQLTQDMKTALKAGDKISLEAIRFLMAQIKNLEIDQGPLDDMAAQQVIAKQIKQTREAMADFERGGRQDLIEQEQAKIEVLQRYLPQQLSEEAVLKIIREAKAQNPGLGAGPLTGQVMQRVRGQADGAMVSRLIQAELAA